MPYETSSTLNQVCPKHDKPVVGDLVSLPKCKVVQPVCEDCVEELRRDQKLLPHSRAMIQMRLI